MPDRSFYVARTLAEGQAALKAFVAARTQDPLALGYCATAPALLTSASATWRGANAGQAVRVIAGGFQISKIALQVGVQSGNISVAVYRGTGSGMARRPTGTPIAQSGAVACPAVGYAEIPLDQAVTPLLGDFLFMSCDNVTASFYMVSGNVSPLQASVGYGKSAGAHPAPDTSAWTSADATAFKQPLLAGVA